MVAATVALEAPARVRSSPDKRLAIVSAYNEGATIRDPLRPAMTCRPVTDPTSGSRIADRRARHLSLLRQRVDHREQQASIADSGSIEADARTEQRVATLR
jgi:hypothetical protein